MMKRTIVLSAVVAAAGVVVLAASNEHDAWSAQRFEIFGTLRSGRQAVLQAFHTLFLGWGAAR